MKYGESTFDILYLLFAITAGCVMLAKARGKTEKLMGFAAFILGVGDAFHLVPRVLNYFCDADFTVWLGVGKLVTSLTMTVFYVLMYHVWRGLYGAREGRGPTAAVYALAALRFALCAFPQNGWLTNESGVLWGVLRNLPFAALGALIVVLYFRKRKESRRFRAVWIYVTLSFLFYIPVAVAAGLVPILGMLMLPKTVCYILLIWTFLLAVLKDEPRNCDKGEKL
ncbi:MAG: hypothetical protein IJU94_06545 [Clostridia bacterium]|nr:hypothetical protein [Clostridia bacterium]